MTPIRVVVAAIWFAAAALALVTAASGLVTAWPLESSSCLPCIGNAINDALGIPGSVFGAAAAVVVTVIVVGSGLGPALGFPSPPGSPGDDVTTYIPGVSPLPQTGDVIYMPSQGASKVTNVYYDPDTFHPDGTPGGIIIETELGSVLVVGIDLDEQ